MIKAANFRISFRFLAGAAYVFYKYSKTRAIGRNDNQQERVPSIALADKA